MNAQTMRLFRQRVRDELHNNIIPFWLTHAADRQHGGFIGWMTNALEVDAQRPKGLILNARLLWTFAALARSRGGNECVQMARYAYETLMGTFWDAECGGAFWRLRYDGQVLDATKKIYGQAFVIYALVEYYLFSGDTEALGRARQVFGLIENHARDKEFDGYYESLDRNWTVSHDQRLSEEDMDVPKSMNNHLHLLEAYTHLYSVWQDDLLRKRLLGLIAIFREHILDSQKRHFRLFFDAQWNSQCARVSFGHDIEGSWLLHRAAEVLNHPGLLAEVGELAVRIARGVYVEGLDGWKGVFYEADAAGRIVTEKHFWCQAEAVVGFLNAYQVGGEEEFMETAWRIWQYIETYQVDKEHGDWFWKVYQDGRPDPDKPKVSEWKCPYHSGRACLEIMRRLDGMIRQLEPSTGKTAQRV